MLPSHDNLCHLRALPSEAVKEVIWIIDGYEFQRTEAPYEAFWPMEKGEHKIMALSDGDVADEVTIFVE